MLCKIAGVSKSGYYKWLKRQDNATDKDLDDQSIVAKIIECHKILILIGATVTLEFKLGLKRRMV
jgi:hypothetical protein